jgi:hypothetical protein
MIKEALNFISGNWLSLLILIIALLTLVITFFMWRKSRKEELSRLRSLLQQIEYIKRVSKDQFDYLKNGNIPSWTISNIDLNFYLTHIQHIIEREGFLEFQNIPSSKLKEYLMDIHGKINNINNMFTLIYHAHVTNTKQSNKRLEEYKKELTRENHYYTTLDKMIEKAAREIKKIIKRIRIHNKRWY